jgi:hypothetical protein
LVAERNLTESTNKEQLMPEQKNEVHDWLPPADFYDPVIEVYKKDVDRTLLRENLKLTVEQRIRKAESSHASIERLRGSARRSTSVSPEGDGE